MSTTHRLQIKELATLGLFPPGKNVKDVVVCLECGFADRSGVDPPGDFIAATQLANECPRAPGEAREVNCAGRCSHSEWRYGIMAIAFSSLAMTSLGSLA